LPVTLEDIDREIARRQGAPAQGGITLEQIDAELARRNQAAPAVASPVGGGAEPLPRGAGIPEMVIQQPARSPLAELTGGAVNRGTLTAAGGTLGGVLGAPAGPVGALAGGGLGAAAGSSAFDVANRAIRSFQGRPQPDVSVPEEAARAVQEGVTDVAFGAGAAALGPLVKSFKPLMGKLLGVSGEPTRKIAEEAAKQGVPLAAVQVSKRPSVKGFSRVLGIFPFVGTPFKDLAKASGQAVEDRASSILNEIAPTATVADLGVDLTKAAKGRFKQFKSVASSLYDDFAKQAEAAGNPSIVPTDSTRQVANQIRDQRAAGRVLVPGARGAQKTLVQPEELRNPLDQFFDNFANIPERLTVTQARGLQRSLNEATKRASSQGFDISRAGQIKQALEQDLNNLDIGNLPPEIGQSIVGSMNRANRFFAEGIKPFQTATGKKFGRVDPNIFSPKFGKAGSANADEAFKAVVNSRSPQAMADLRRLVGPQAMKGVARRNVEDALAKAQASGAPKGSSLSFDPGNLATNLGLDSADGRKVLAESLKGTDITVDQLEKFVDVARAASDFTVPDVSSFLQRRFTLGGVRSILGGATLAAGVSSPPVGVALAILARKGSQVLSSPSALRAMTNALDDTVSDQVRRAAVLRLARAVVPDDEAPEVPF